MEDLSVTAILIIVVIILLGLIASGMYIALVMGLVGIFMLFFMLPGKTSLAMLGTLQYNAVADCFALVALPLFIFMGHIILRSGMAERLYKGATPLVGFLPGGLLHTNIVSCAIFAAMCGSSLATAATIGSIAIPLQIDRRNYSSRSVLGSVAAGGTLGILIPPSITLIVYGVFVGDSVGKLFAAGLIPGIVLTLIFMFYIGTSALLRPHLAPSREIFSPKAMRKGMLEMWPALLLICLILGTIYAGLATPTEAAAFGSTIAMIMALAYRKLNFEVIKEASTTALKLASFMILILVTARIVGTALSQLRVPQELTAVITASTITTWQLFLMLLLMYLILGCFLEPGSMMFLTLPLVHPVITSLGFSSIWLGVMMVIMVELANITPPVGFNLYVIHGISGGRPMIDIVRGVIPYFFCMIAMVVLLYFFPQIALWLPDLLISPR